MTKEALDSWVVYVACKIRDARVSESSDPQPCESAIPTTAERAVAEKVVRRLVDAAEHGRDFHTVMAFLVWLIEMDDADSVVGVQHRRTVTLGTIIERARNVFDQLGGTYIGEGHS